MDHHEPSSCFPEMERGLPAQIKGCSTIVDQPRDEVIL